MREYADADQEDLRKWIAVTTIISYCVIVSLWARTRGVCDDCRDWDVKGVTEACWIIDGVGVNAQGGGERWIVAAHALERVVP